MEYFNYNDIYNNLNNLKFSDIIIKNELRLVDYDDSDIIEKIKEDNKKIREKITNINLAKLSDDNFLVSEFFLKNPIIYDDNKYWWIWDEKKMKYVMCKDDIDITIKFNNTFDILEVKTSYAPGTRSTILNALKEASKTFYKQYVKEVPKNCVAFKDAIVNIETGEIYKNSFKYFSINVIPHEYLNSKDTATPMIDKLFEDWVKPKNKKDDDGKDWTITLKEIFAYSMLPSYPIEDIFIFYGSGSNGKSTCLNLLTKFIGMENTTSVEFSKLISPNQRFVTSKLYKKLLCLMGEIDDMVVKNHTRLKEIVSGKDIISAEFKNKSGFEFINYAKIIMATNYIPSTTDLSDAYARRFVIMDFPNSFSQMGVIVKKIPEHELSNLARQLIPVLRNLYLRNRLTNEGTIKEKKERYHKRSDPVQSFVNECCVKSTDGLIPVWEFNEYFEEWRSARNHKPMSKKAVTQFLKSSNMGVEVVLRRLKEKNTSWRYYQGIDWNPKYKKLTVEITEDGAFENKEILDVNNSGNNNITDLKNYSDRIYTKDEVYDLFSSFPKSEVDEKIKTLKKIGEVFEVRNGEYRFQKEFVR